MPSAISEPVEIDYNEFISPAAKNRVRNPLKTLRPYVSLPGIISFGGGMPHPSTWPVNAMTVSVPFAGQSVFVPGYNSPTPDSLLPLAPYNPPSKTDPAPNLVSELQYANMHGAPHLVSWLTEHAKRIHNPPYAGWSVSTTAGNTDGVDAVIRTVLKAGDNALVEEFAYPGLLSALHSAGVKATGVPMDGDGVLDSAIDETLANWNEGTQGPRPKVFILVPTCSNPSGITVPEYRKKDIYAVCRKWNILIVEDDPYCFLQIRPEGASKPIVPSFLSLDIDGRVIRVDSFSKIVSPGSRLGWITGPSQLVQQIMFMREGSTQCPSGWSVAAISAVLRAWGGHEGFEQKYLPHISDIYAKRCLLMVSQFEKYLPTSICEWPSGSGGMFLWLRLKIRKHPNYSTKSLEEISDQIFKTLIEEKLITAQSFFFKAPGKEWSKEEEAERVFLRLSFSYPSEEDIEEGVKRLAKGLKKEWGL
ncbi:hypothetical protein TREMEDRAFT_68672 [Tremella mesenterica DSM 1558]|uniref:uncharacterized protein n=1 Tax=Tremella mesenterica (strain ATCC 24925 / CBS 8224 / DSM 1558 / NBRC 9311 / NRRL Y-6157 / RJB 2259-6 / UBC 559-6) TaxID=578456 RepID=UPI0003F491A3|nr:uncharacterized protein TREMEDRAFT_68672 [Tremella mesenterica DSM 1558]EIW69404.1 hypothetical protein TREMEDRAFT_68672 [Tremella mesenterica DSM 1558]